MLVKHNPRLDKLHHIILTDAAAPTAARDGGRLLKAPNNRRDEDVKEAIVADNNVEEEERGGEVGVPALTNVSVAVGLANASGRHHLLPVAADNNRQRQENRIRNRLKVAVGRQAIL